MQKMTLSQHPAIKEANSGRPTMPSGGRQPMIERKIYDPSSAAPKGERYPIPAFFEYRIKPRDYDPL
jgi:hypothetical protein